jgi:hypothetical protein
VVEHRRTVSRRGSVLPGWFFVVAAVISLAGAGTLGWLTWDSLRPESGVIAAPAESPSPSPTPTESATPSPSPSDSPSPSPTPSESPSPTPSPTPEVTRSDIGVSVLNASGVQGLAAQVGGRVTQAGWTVTVVGNWRGGAPQTAVHYPQGREAEAELLAQDLGVPTAPAVQGMSGDRLTVLVLSVP